MDMKDLENPEYESSEPTEKSSDTVSIRIKKFANSAPFKAAGVDANQTVADFEQNLARKMQWSNRTTRLAINGELVDRKMRMGEVAERLGDSGVLELIPDHKVGAINFSAIGGFSPTFFNISEVNSQLISQRINKTDYTRVEVDLRDLPYKTTPNFAYGEDFKVEVNSLEPNDIVLPILQIKILGRFYPVQLILAGYPFYIKGCFLHGVPPCPKHKSGQHPHIYQNGDICWSLESSWEPSMSLYDDYIRFLIKILRNPQEHILCQA